MTGSLMMSFKVIVMILSASLFSCSSVASAFCFRHCATRQPHRHAAKLLNMVRTRGLEVRTESATPKEGGMQLYIKAGPDGTSVGDCPFAHYVQMVLNEKGLEYEVNPSTSETKPNWLVEHYQGKLPALRHRKECYVESDVIAQYLDFFFRNPPLSLKKSDTRQAQEAIDGFFPAVAKYLKHTPDGDDDDLQLKATLEESLEKLETHLQQASRSGPYLVGNGEALSLLDCSLAPKLYHLQVGVETFKDGSIDFEKDYPCVHAYMESVFERPSFTDSLYPKDTVVWGWTNARENETN